MKKLMVLILVASLLAACGGNETKTVKQEPVQEAKTEPKKMEPKKQEDEKAVKPTIDESKVSFTNFSFEIEKAKVKGNKLILDTLYTNDSFPGEKAFMAAGIISVTQSDKELEEVSGVQSNSNSNYFYKNKPGIWAPIAFEYELPNQTDDVVVEIISTDFENPEEKTITISFE